MPHIYSMCLGHVGTHSVMPQHTCYKTRVCYCRRTYTSLVVHLHKHTHTHKYACYKFYYHVLLSLLFFFFHVISVNCTPPAIEDFPHDLFDESQRRAGAVVVHFILSLYLFVALAVVCDKFFVPAVERICSGNDQNY